MMEKMIGRWRITLLRILIQMTARGYMHIFIARKVIWEMLHIGIVGREGECRRLLWKVSGKV